MSKLIRQLLGESEPMFSVGLTRIEKAAGNPGEDVQLTADIIGITRIKLHELGLDPSDTTGEELYSALRAKLATDNEIIGSYLGHPASLDQATYKTADLLKNMIPKTQVWAVKNSVLKSILREVAPKQVMKAFHFNSVDSMIKRMSIEEIILATRVLESKTWQEKYKRRLSQLGTKDFGSASLTLIPLTDMRWLAVLEKWMSTKGHMVLSAKECASIGFAIPMSQFSLMNNIPLILHSVNELLLYGLFLKLHYVNQSIGTIIVSIFDDQSQITTQLGSMEFHWRDVQNFLAQNQSLRDDDIFVHLDDSDFVWVDSMTSLSLIIPELSFWIGTDFCGVVYGEHKIVSLNVHDVALSVATNQPYQHMQTTKLQRSLRVALMSRYLHYPIARALVLKQFDISVISEENW